VAALGVAGDLGEQAEPASQELAHGVSDLLARPAGGDHLLEHPNVP
jgi:hypothetical protein